MLFIDKLISLISSHDLAIKKNTLESLSMIAFNPQLKSLLADKINEIVNITLYETPVKKELITQVDLGPFKYNVDNGVPVRKAAFMLLENVTEKYVFNQNNVVEATINGFQDSNDDVLQQCLRSMNKLLNICPFVVLEHLDKLVEKMNTIYQKNSNNLKDHSKDGQGERSLNLIRGILRISERLQKIPEA